MTILKPPSVFDYLDLTGYLADYYSYRKELNKSFSYQTWADELDFNTSRSFLRMIVIGKKKASPLFVTAFSRQNFSSPIEEEYFYYLNKHSQAATQKDKNVYSSRLLAILKTNIQQKKVDNYSDFISTPLMPRLLTMTSFEDLHRTAITFATLLELPVGLIESSLSILRELGLVKSVESEGETLWHALTSHFDVPDNKGNLNLIKFHEMSLQEAIQAFHKPKELRKYKALLLVMSEEERATFNKLVEDFMAEQLLRFTGNTYSGRKVYQVNLNVHAISV